MHVFYFIGGFDEYGYAEQVLQGVNMKNIPHMSGDQVLRCVAVQDIIPQNDWNYVEENLNVSFNYRVYYKVFAAALQQIWTVLKCQTGLIFRPAMLLLSNQQMN